MISLVILKKLLSPLGGVIFTPFLLGLEANKKGDWMWAMLLLRLILLQIYWYDCL